MYQPLDERLNQRIRHLVTEGVTNVQEMKRHLSMCLKNEIFGGINLPLKTNKRYYPRIRAIRNQKFLETKIEKVTD